MDAWAALWFWPLTDTDGATPPTLDQWIEACQQLLGREPEARKKNRGMTPLGDGQQLGRPERGRGTQPRLRRRGQTSTQVLKNHPWLKVCETVADQQGFFHWELDFATVFARGGFDLQLGNPPGCGRRRTSMHCSPRAIRGGSWLSNQAKQLATPSETRHWRFRESAISSSSATTDVVVTAEYLGSAQAYPLLAGLQPTSIAASWSRPGSMPRERYRYSDPS